MAATCQSGYVWSTSPTTGSHTAQCTNVSGSGQWVFAGGETCAGNCYFNLLLIVMNLHWNSIKTRLNPFPAQVPSLNCSFATISGSYIYTVPSSSNVGSVMSVSCPSGTAWSSAPVYSSHNATCTNMSNSGQWVFSNGESCVGIFFILQYSHILVRVYLYLFI